MASIRQEKVARQVQKDLSEILSQDLPHLLSGKMVTVTTVRIAPDMGYARIYVSIFPNEGKTDHSDKLNEHSAEIRNLLARRFKNQMRKVPELKFFDDDSLDYAERIDQLLKD